MKKVLAILIFISLFSQGLAQLGILGYYQLNKDYIAKNLCENRDKPKMKCNGKCYLSKQLKKTEGSSSSKNLPTKTEKNEIVAYVLPSRIVSLPVLKTTETAPKNPVSQHLYGHDISVPVFHPPSSFC